MTIVIKEIVVKATVENERKERQTEVVSEELIARLKDDILREIRSARLVEAGKKKGKISFG